LSATLSVTLRRVQIIDAPQMITQGHHGHPGGRSGSPN